MAEDAGTEALSGGEKPKPKEGEKKDKKPGGKKKGKGSDKLREMHIKELHDGTFHVERSSRDKSSGMPSGLPAEYSSPDTGDLHDQVDDHFAPGGGAGGEEGEEPEPDSQPGVSEPQGAAVAGQ